MTPPAADGGLPGPLPWRVEKPAYDGEYFVDASGIPLDLEPVLAWINAQAARLAGKDAECAKWHEAAMKAGVVVCEDGMLIYTAQRQLAAATERLASAEAAIAPFARLSVPKKPEGNAGFYSLLFADIEAARAWRDAKDGEKQP